jgi:hypothetical protein
VNNARLTSAPTSAITHAAPPGACWFPRTTKSSTRTCFRTPAASPRRCSAGSCAASLAYPCARWCSCPESLPCCFPVAWLLTPPAAAPGFRQVPMPPSCLRQRGESPPPLVSGRRPAATRLHHRSPWAR